MPTYTTEGIVLRHQNFGEADRLLTIFTRGAGKVRAKARSVRKVGSKLAGHLDLLACSQIQFATGKTDLELVTQCQTIITLPAVRQNFIRTSAGLYAAELTDKITEFGAPDSRLYELLKQYLLELDRVASHKILQHLAYYTYHLLAISGFAPELTRCASCQKLLSEDSSFHVVSQGELRCADCAVGMTASHHIPAHVFKALRFLAQKDQATFLLLRLGASEQESLKQLLEDLAIHVVDRDLAASHLLAQG